MSSRSKDSKKSRDKRGDEGRPVIKRPASPVPIPSVLSRHEGNMVERNSKGFSYGEVANSGMAVLTAKRWGVPMDLRRRSVLERNVHELKGWYSKAARSGGPGEAKRLEEEIEKIGREAEKEIKKGATKVKKEAVKVEKGAKRLEEDVVEKVEEPVKKRRAKKASKDTKDKDPAQED